MIELNMSEFNDIRNRMAGLLYKTNYRVSRIRDITVVGSEDSYGLWFGIKKGILGRLVAEVLLPREDKKLKLFLFENRETRSNLESLERLVRDNIQGITVDYKRKTNPLYESFFLDRYY